MTEQQIPGWAEDSNERLTQRGYETDFARLPDAEVESIPVPGGGPQGSVSGRKSVPLMVVAVGFAVLFTTFGFESVLPLAIGLVLIVGGLVWSNVRNRTEGKGSGRVTIRSGG